jgi:DNA-binding LytR/AlgR family response regulator
MLRCIAIDDEELALELLADNIRKVPFLELVGLYRHPMDALKASQEQPVDLVFLDIQMPGITGLQFIQYWRTTSVMFILITAYEQYALEGYELDIVDYLVKPVSLDRFVKACNKAQSLRQLRNQVKTADPSLYFIFFPVDYSMVRVDLQSILYIEGMKDYIKIFTTHSKHAVIARMAMGQIALQLTAPRFVRIHRSYIVSLASVTSVKRNTVHIQKTELPVGLSYRDQLWQLIGSNA